MWLVLWSASRLPPNCETLYTTLKRHFSQMICLLPLLRPTLLQLVFFPPVSLHPSVYSGSIPPPFLSLPSKPSNLQTSFLSQHKGRYVRLCVTLVVPCPAHVLAVSTAALLSHSHHVPPVLPQTAIMCLSAAQRAAEWRLFSIPPAIYLTLG